MNALAVVPSYGLSARRRIIRKGATEIGQFIDEVPAGARTAVFNGLPRVPGFRVNQKTELAERRKRFIARLTEVPSDAMKNPRDNDWDAFRRLWIEWGGSKFGREARPVLNGEVAQKTGSEPGNAIGLLSELREAVGRENLSREDLARLLEFSGFEDIDLAEKSLESFPRRAEQERVQRLESLEPRLVALTGKIEQIDSAWTKRLEVVAANVGTTEGRFEELQRSSTNMSLKIDELSQSVERKIGELSKSVEADVKQAETLRLEVRRLTEEMEALRTERNSSFMASMEANKADIDSIRGEVGALQASLQELNHKIAETAAAGPSSAGHERSIPQMPSRPDWSGMRGEDIKDAAALRRILTSAARARGIDPSTMLQVHAAVVARLMPITLGPAALAALIAYAHGACAGRSLIVHVSPSAIQSNDFDDLPQGGLLAAAEAAKDVDGLALVVLEGANRSPLEASVVPLLQTTEIGLSPLSSARGLRLAASLVSGATTVPVTPQLWSHAAAIYPEAASPSAQTGNPGEIALASELLVPGDEPTSAIDALLDKWPDCRELRPAMSRLGSALTRLYKDEARLSAALLHGLVLPYVATALTAEEQAAAVDSADDADGTIDQVLRRLRRQLA